MRSGGSSQILGSGERGSRRPLAFGGRASRVSGFRWVGIHAGVQNIVEAFHILQSFHVVRTVPGLGSDAVGWALHHDYLEGAVSVLRGQRERFSALLEERETRWRRSYGLWDSFWTLLSPLEFLKLSWAWVRRRASLAGHRAYAAFSSVRLVVNPLVLLCSLALFGLLLLNANDTAQSLVNPFDTNAGLHVGESDALLRLTARRQSIQARLLDASFYGDPVPSRVLTTFLASEENAARFVPNAEHILHALIGFEASSGREAAIATYNASCQDRLDAVQNSRYLKRACTLLASRVGRVSFPAYIVYATAGDIAALPLLARLADRLDPEDRLRAASVVTQTLSFSSSDRDLRAGARVVARLSESASPDGPCGWDDCS